MKNEFMRNLKKENISLVLSGGTSYGLAHVGVFKFLEENSIKVSEVIGSSMGSLVAAFYAAGKNSKEMEKIVKNTKIKTLLGTSSKKLTKKVEIFLENHFGDRKMKDVSVPLKIMATDLKTGKGRLFTYKDDLLISDVLLASIAIPGIFNPKVIRERLYFDGGVHSNLPVECAKPRNIKIASNVVNKHKRFLEDKKKFFIFSNILRKIHELQYTVHYLLENQTDSKLPFVKKLILIEPDMREFSSYSFKKYKKIIKKGYDSCKNRFEKERFEKY